MDMTPLKLKAEIKSEQEKEPETSSTIATEIESDSATKPEELDKRKMKEETRKRTRMSKIPNGSRIVYHTNIAKKVLQAGLYSKKNLGAHVSAAGSLENAIHNAIEIGCRSFALFVRNQRRWDSKPLEQAVVERWNDALKETNFPLDQIVPHGSYLMNAGSPDETKLEKTRVAMLDECSRCERLGIQFYNFHPGSTTGKCTMEQCISTVAETINYIQQKTGFITLVVETMAGSSNGVGGKFADLRRIIDQVKDKNRVGVCIDTCHIFAAGYDIKTKYEEVMREFDSEIGFNYLKAVHLNDSKGKLNSKLDRHENIGEGEIGTEGFGFLMNDPRFDGIPMLLETPEGKYSEEMILLYELEEKKNDKNKKLKKA